MEALGSGSTQHRTVLSAGFSIFLHWKVAVNRVQNLRSCTRFLFPVYTRIYYSLNTVLYLTYKWTGISGWEFFVPKHCSIFTVILMCTADTVGIL